MRFFPPVWTQNKFCDIEAEDTTENNSEIIVLLINERVQTLSLEASDEKIDNAATVTTKPYNVIYEEPFSVDVVS